MEQQHRAAAAILAAALLAGLAGDLLLRYIPWGLNIALWTLLIIGGALYARSRAQGAPVHLGAIGICLLLAGGIVWRDSPILAGADIALLIVFLPMLALHARGARLASAELSDLLVALLTTLAQSVAGFPQLLIRDLSWSRVPRGGFQTAKVATRGSLMAAPALLIFGSLLWHADPAFARLLRQFFGLDLRDLVQHAIVTAFFFATSAGFLRSLALSGPMPQLLPRGVAFLPIAETNVALLLINLLFATFVGVQFRYFFGANLSATASKHARRGFFELVTVVALVLPLLLLLDFLVKKEQLRAFRALAAVMVALVFVIALSAYWRMQLYRDAFGLTQLRLYTTAFMIWIAVLLLWFALTVLTGHRERFAIGAVSAGMVILFGLHAINPDALIVKTNLARTRGTFDAVYATSLSEDATPLILANAGAFPKTEIDKVLTRQRTIGWRTWNVSRARAIAAVRDYESKATPPMGRP